MKPAHTFASKKEEKLSLAWLDENFQQPLDLIDGLVARLDSMGLALAAANQRNEFLASEVARLGNTEVIAERVIMLLKNSSKVKKK